MMSKIITTNYKYNLEMHKKILGVYQDVEGNEYIYQPERLNPEAPKGDAIVRTRRINKGREVSRNDLLA